MMLQGHEYNFTLRPEYSLTRNFNITGFIRVQMMKGVAICLSPRAVDERTKVETGLTMKILRLLNLTHTQHSLRFVRAIFCSTGMIDRQE